MIETTGEVLGGWLNTAELTESAGAETLLCLTPVLVRVTYYLIHSKVGVI